jgi:hypothetical protein
MAEPKRATKIALVGVLCYMIILPLVLLVYFPWRDPSAQKAQAIWHRKDLMDREFIRTRLREAKQSPMWAEEEKLRKMIDPRERTEDEEIDDYISSIHTQRNTYRRMPSWKEPVSDALDMTSAISGGTTKMSFDFKAPNRAWDRFFLELMWGLGALLGAGAFWFAIMKIRAFHFSKG